MPPMTRTLVILFGDQLDLASAAFDGFDPAQDAILQMEVREEATYIRQHKLRLAYFFANMRHFCNEQRKAGRTVHYAALDDPANTGSFSGEITRHLQALSPEHVVAVQPGDWRVRAAIDALDLPIDWRADRHFLCSTKMFEGFLAEHRRPILETFYRFMRRRLHILIDDGGDPVGGAWNFDHDNRAALGRNAPPIPPALTFPANAVTQEAVAMVRRKFPDNPGRLEQFSLPIGRAQSLELLADFVVHRLPHFGRYQDAMRGGEPFVFHSRLSGPMNLHLLTPAEIVRAVLQNPADAPLNAVEGFLRQIIGWREFVRGMYWHHMPDYAARNALDAYLPMPRFYWTGETDMRCLHEAIGHTIEHAYAHHIERLMVLGLYALLLGVHPTAVHEWHMSMFWDAIDWVSLPNAAGMGQHADGGIMGTKPYIASGAYINRMSDHCRHCRYDPRKSVGDDACPFTTLYWDFLARHRGRFANNVRMGNMFANLDRKDDAEIAAIRVRAETLRAG